MGAPDGEAMIGGLMLLIAWWPVRSKAYVNGDLALTGW